MIRITSKKVLVPTDFSDPAKSALHDALDYATDPSDITALHVAPPLASYPVADPAIVWESVSEEARTRQLEEAFRENINDPRAAEVKFEVAFGNPAEEIAHFAEQNQIDLILMPSHGYTGLKRMLVGSVAEHVVRAAHCPVLVLRN